MSISTAFLLLSLLFWGLYLACLFTMASKVSRTTGEIGYPRFSFFKTPLILERYREITTAERGRPGPAYGLFYTASVMVILTAGASLLTMC
jgi:hypothetical protein